MVTYIPYAYKPRRYSTLFGEYIPEAEKLLGTGREVYVWDVAMQKSLSATAVEFVEGGIETHLNLQVTYSQDKLGVFSASTDDKSAAAGAIRKVKKWIIRSDHNYEILETAMSGITVNSSSKDAMDVGVVYASLLGTTADKSAAGSIKVGFLTKHTDAVLTIVSHDLHSHCTRVPICKGWRCKIHSLHGHWQTAPESDSICYLFPQYDDRDAAFAERGSTDAVGFHKEGNFGPDHFTRIYGNDSTNGRLTLYGYVQGGAKTVGIVVRYLLWAEPTGIGSGQVNYIVGG
jgi:hypothetical protein